MSNLPDYLRKYVEGPVEQETNTKKKKKKSKGPVKKIEGMRIVDETVEVKPVVQEEEEEDDPTVVEIGFRHRELLGEVTDYNPKLERKTDRDLSPPRKRHDSDDDLDVPRKSAISTKEDSSPPRRRRKDDDISPPRRRHDSDNDMSPPRKKSDDLSPPRKSNNKTDQSPPRRSRHDSDDDISPPRKTQTDSSPPRKPKNADISPPRRKRHDSDEDISPPRKSRHDSDNDLSPQRKSKDKDISPPRRARHDSDDDLSPPRKEESKPAVKPPVATLKMSSGSRAGLIHATEISKEEAELKRKRAEKLAKLDPSQMGKDSAVVYRDKQGKKMLIPEVVKQDKGNYLEDEEANMEWGKGLVQKKDKEDIQAYIEREKLKPFIRTIDDQDLNMEQKTKDRWGDPMLALMNVSTTDSSFSHLQEDEEEPKAKKSKKEKRSKKEKKDKKEKKKALRWKGVAAANNRFGILPGKYWDGVDRSNGFEHKLLTRESESIAKQEEAYLWSVEDM